MKPVRARKAEPALDEDAAALADLEAERWVEEEIDGVRLMSPRPGPKHALVASQIASLLSPFNDKSPGDGGPKGWWILFASELRLFGARRVVPDVAGWRIESMRRLPQTSYFKLPPDWVCEVLSKGTATIDRYTKLPKYAGAGIPHVWLVDPQKETVEVLALPEGAGAYRRLASARGARARRLQPFDAVPFPMRYLWGH